MAFKNKKAGERVLSIYLFIIYIIVSVGIVSGVIVFYGSPLDLRIIEAGILSNKVIDCLIDQGKLKSDKNILEPNFDLLTFCNFDFKDNSQKYEGEEQYAVKTEFFYFDSCSKSNRKTTCSQYKKETQIFGNKDFLEFCGSRGDKIPKCNKREVYVLNGDEKLLIRITSAVGKVQNV